MAYVSDQKFNNKLEKDLTTARKIARKVDGKKGIVRFDMATGIAGLAKPLAKGVKRGYLDIRQKWQGGCIEFRGGELTAVDLGVLFAIINLAQRTEPEPDIGAEIVGLLPLLPNRNNEENLARKKNTLTINTNYAEVNRLLGKATDGNNIATIKEALKVLSLISVYIEDGKKWGMTHLINHCIGDDKSLTISLNYRIAEVLLGESSSYGKLSLKTYNELPTSVSKITYSYLVNLCGARTELKIGINTLIESVWQEPIAKLSKAVLNDRRTKIRSALKSIDELSHLKISAESQNEVVNVFKRPIV